MSTKKKLMFYCQHVLGMGHFIRSAEIVRGLTGFEVYFLNGGEIVPGFDLPAAVEVINLPPIKADTEFRGIHSADTAQTLEEVKAARKQQILAEYERIRPHVLIIELFPFGRLKFDFELLPLLERCKASRETERRTKVVCSLRDILVGKRDQQKFEEKACRIANEYFDLLLVHSDPRFQRLEETFPQAAKIKCPVRYTGFVVQPVVESRAPQVDEFMTTGSGKKILVSIGGGRVGSELVDCAIEASVMLADKLPHRMLIFTGPFLPETEFQRLQDKAGKRPNIKLMRYTTDFPALLRLADLSISMAGYNTCMNIVTSGVRAIVYPFTGNNNQEQTIRAVKLSELGVVEVIHSHELNAANLAEKMQLAIGKPKSSGIWLDVKGAEKTATALVELVDADS